MTLTQYVEWTHGYVKKYKFDGFSQEEVIEILKDDINSSVILKTWVTDENGKRIAYLDKNNQLILGEEKLKKETKENILKQVNESIWVRRSDIKSVLNSLEEKGYINFKEEPKSYKVFVKIVSINGENKKLYYVTDSNLTDNIDEAKRFEIDEKKDGYAYELVEE